MSLLEHAAPAETIDRAYGWVVFYNARAFVETQNFQHRLVGNGPILVLRHSGAFHFLFSGLPVDEELRRLEVTLGLRA